MPRVSQNHDMGHQNVDCNQFCVLILDEPLGYSEYASMGYEMMKLD